MQAPALAGAQPIAVADRVYTADQTSNTLTVISPATNTVLGTIALGNPRPDDLLGALYNKQINTHGLGFSADGKLLAAVNVTTNLVSVIDTATNAVRGTVYLRRAPHEAFFTPDGKEIWVAVRGEGHVAVIDVATLKETMQIQTSDGAAMVIFRPDGAVAFVGAGSERQIQEDWNSMQTTIPKDFWNELKQERLIEKNASTPAIGPPHQNGRVNSSPF